MLVDKLSKISINVTPKADEFTSWKGVATKLQAEPGLSRDACRGAPYYFLNLNVNLK